MFKLSYGYLLSGIATGLILITIFIFTLPDGKLHLVICDVGQGDAAYIRFPDGRDMLIDGGPNDAVIGCLGRYMPFWDREINLVVLSHPQKDHLAGLISVFKRFKVDYFVKSDIENPTEVVSQLNQVVKEKSVPVKLVTAGEKFSVGSTTLSVIWPSAAQIAKGKSLLSFARPGLTKLADSNSKNVLGLSSTIEMNDYSVVILLRYGSFDALFPGDADNHVNSNFIGEELALQQDSGQADDGIEVLKVPHHGSKTGMTEEFAQWLRPRLAVVSVGKNNYGQPNPESLSLLSLVGSRVLRTDKDGDIEIISDGRNWTVTTSQKNRN